jgi:hypothetical protein
MAEGREKHTPPSTKLAAFNCPHCHVLTSQTWFAVHAEALGKGRFPLRVTNEAAEKATFEDVEDPEKRKKLKAYFQRLSLGRPFILFERHNADYQVNNVSISVCYSCNEPTIWVNDRILWPARGEVPTANADLPSGLLADFEEAGAVLDASPRGAAALLRLVIQKLCQHLGGKGQNLDDDIAMLVKKGLDPRVQQSLDVVRVIGNNAVHPGKIDLRDDRDTAEKLFGLVNLIVEIMISQPKHIKEMYESLPDGARKAIERRDA